MTALERLRAFTAGLRAYAEQREDTRYIIAADTLDDILRELKAEQTAGVTLIHRLSQRFRELAERMEAASVDAN